MIITLVSITRGSFVSPCSIRSCFHNGFRMIFSNDITTELDFFFLNSISINLKLTLSKCRTLTYKATHTHTNIHTNTHININTHTHT